jgi:hypothetical protein
VLLELVGSLVFAAMENLLPDVGGEVEEGNTHDREVENEAPNARQERRKEP